VATRIVAAKVKGDGGGNGRHDGGKPKRPPFEHGYRPRVVVKLRDYVDLPYEDRAERHVEKLQVGPWDKLEAEFPGVTLRRMFTLPVARLHELQGKAQALDPRYRPARLTSYFVVDVPPGHRPEALIAALSRWETVEKAYFDPPGDEPVVTPGDDPRRLNQGYLDVAPGGIDAAFVWPQGAGVGFAGGDGQGVRVVDLERGWTLDHEDLSAHGAQLLHGGIRDGSRAHGTSVLGEICAVDNAIGCLGIAPNIGAVNVVSYWNSTRPDAILAAIADLGFGDILLLEAQVSFNVGATSWINMPIEALDAEFDAIRLASALGIVVVEAAGNGSTDLDTFVDAGGDQVLARGAAGFRDSGAIMVGAGSAAAPHQRLGFSNFGSRVDCYAWGESVNTLSSDDTGTTTLYTATFNGTSSASPIVTGAAVLVQAIAEQQLGYRFSPLQVRGLLTDPATSTASNDPAADRIGVMPNLRALMQNDVLNLAPDVYLRDHVGDDGDPHNGTISASPDIIVRPDPVADPQGSFGEGSGLENDASLGYEVEAGQDNHIYVRARNRGGSAATNVQATVYWCPVATLLTPDLWSLVGAVNLASVPSGDVLTVSGGLTWPSAQIPATGHYCFVGILGHPRDPAPDPGDLASWDNFYRFVREHNNVTWRNFNVVDNEPSAGEPAVALPFLAVGAPDRPLPMELVVGGRLPVGVKLELAAPPAMFEALHLRTPFLRVEKKKHEARLPLNPHGRNLLGKAVFPAKMRAPMRLLVRVPPELRKHAYEVHVRQLFEGREVGRVTWRLAPRRRKSPGGDLRQRN
jgi:subtilisin family serine protease